MQRLPAVWLQRRLRALCRVLALDLHPRGKHLVCPLQGGITCGAIEDPRKSSKAIDERVIINFRDKNGVIARFRDKNVYR